jgi:hypothetical protein
MELTTLRRMMQKRGNGEIRAAWTDEDDKKFRADVLRCIGECGEISGVNVQGIFWGDDPDVLDVLVDPIPPSSCIAHFRAEAADVLRELGGFGNDPKIRIRPSLTVE